jgi:hypothetical protein
MVLLLLDSHAVWPFLSLTGKDSHQSWFTAWHHHTSTAEVPLAPQLCLKAINQESYFIGTHDRLEQKRLEYQNESRNYTNKNQKEPATDSGKIDTPFK